MSYAAIHADIDQTGRRLDTATPNPAPTPGWTTWHGVWSEMFRTQAIRSLPRTTATLVICYAVEALPIAELILVGTTTKMLSAIEQMFGSSASDMAKMLKVSRPMIYHYRDGMEPSPENRRRLQTLAVLASEFNWLGNEPLSGLLKVKQPEGKTLLEFLSDDQLDVPAVRRVLERNIKTADKALRNHLAAALIHGETSEQRSDIVRERHKAGRPIYVGDPEAPGKLIQILPNGRRVRGRMVKRRFVPDEK